MPNTANIYWKFQQKLLFKSKFTAFIYICKFAMNMFYRGRIFLTDLNTPILNVWGSVSRVKRRLTKGSMRRQFSPLNWKCHVIIVFPTDLSGFVVTMHSHLCDQFAKRRGRGIWLAPCLHAPSCIVTIKPSRTSHNPLLRSPYSL